MRIENIRQENVNDRSRIAARVTWEDSDRGTQEIYFEVDERFSEALCCRPDPFLVAAIMPALWHGEKRVAVDGQVCPDLRAGLVTTMAVIQHWYNLPRDLV